MSRKTVSQLDVEIQEIKTEMSNVQLSAGTCWNHAQMGAILERFARHGELVKAEITIDHGVSSNGYHYQIWHRPLLNPESRKNDEHVIAGMSGHDFTPERK